MPTQVKTIMQVITSQRHRESADDALNKHLSDGWMLVDLTVLPPRENDGLRIVERVVTLSEETADNSVVTMLIDQYEEYEMPISESERS